MNIVYITAWKHSNPYAYSASYELWQALERAGCNVQFIDDLRTPKTVFMGQCCKWTYHKIAHSKKYNRLHDHRLSKAYARQVSKRLKAMDLSKIDLVLSPSTIPIAFLPKGIPVVYWVDAHFAGLIDYYFHGLPESSKQEGIALETAALARCELAIYTSDWAADFARKYSPKASGKIRVLQYGTKISCDRSLADIQLIVKRRDRRVCRLLFAGIDWERKNGDYAVEVCLELNRMGVPSRLTILGANPKIRPAASGFVDVLGFLEKDSEAWKTSFNESFQNAHFFILPSKADCVPNVIGESNSFGVPCVATLTGGVGSAIREGFNGHLFDPTTAPVEVAKWIAGVFLDPVAYEKIAMRSFEEYSERLSWSGSIKRFLNLVVNQQIVSKQ